MILKQLAMPYLASAITSDHCLKLKRGWFRLRTKFSPTLNNVTFYHRVNDPYSYLLLQLLPQFLEDFDVRFEIKFVLDLPGQLNPEPVKLEQYALEDARCLARFHKLAFPDNPLQPSAQDSFKATSILFKHRSNGIKALEPATRITAQLWDPTAGGYDIEGDSGLSEVDTRRLIQQSKTQLVADGHYMSGMLHYGGEWYWGVDRIAYLAKRLTDGGMRRQTDELSKLRWLFEHPLRNVESQYDLAGPTQSVDFYFSFRSPYSYLAIERLYILAERYQFSVNIKPVLPMVMRGLSVPEAKRMYIVHDAKREACRYNIPFGKIADPLGAGVERCMALFPYAKAKGKERAYITAVTTGIWSQGADVCKNSVMERLLTEAGLNWEEAKGWLNNKSWVRDAEKNRTDLETLGLWGVPAFKYGKLVVWGQDRLWSLEQEFKTSGRVAKAEDSGKAGINSIGHKATSGS